MSICLLLKLIGCFGSKLLIRKSEASKNNLFTWPCQLLIMLMMRWRSFSWISVFRLWRLGWSWCSVRTDLMKRILTSGGHFLQTEKYFNIRQETRNLSFLVCIYGQKVILRIIYGQHRKWKCRNLILRWSAENCLSTSEHLLWLGFLLQYHIKSFKVQTWNHFQIYSCLFCILVKFSDKLFDIYS